MRNLYIGIQLHLAPCLEDFVGIEGIAFLAKKMKVRQASHVVGERDIISSPALRSDWGWSPQVTVYFPTKDRCALALANLCDRLSSGLRINARFTEVGFSRRCIIKPYACHKTVLHK